jgi:hypothetical protein
MSLLFGKAKTTPARRRGNQRLSEQIRAIPDFLDRHFRRSHMRNQQIELIF